MTPEAQLLTHVLAWGTLLFQLVIIFLLLLLFIEWKTKQQHALLRIVRIWGLHVAFLVTLTGSILTLIYSEVFGLAPCGLCWLQRVFLYPQTILLGLALWKRDRGIVDYVIGLSLPGFLIALYQHFIQMGGTDFLPCPAVADSADCAQRIVFEFGYMTFPLMSATVFAFLILLSLIAMWPRREYYK